MEALEKKIDTLAKAMAKGFTNNQNQALALRAEMKAGFSGVNAGLEGVEERLKELGVAFDKDSETLIKQERRISSMEQRLA